MILSGIGSSSAAGPWPTASSRRSACPGRGSAHRAVASGDLRACRSVAQRIAPLPAAICACTGPRPSASSRCRRRRACKEQVRGLLTSGGLQITRAPCAASRRRGELGRGELRARKRLRQSPAAAGRRAPRSLTAPAHLAWAPRGSLEPNLLPYKSAGQAKPRVSSSAEATKCERNSKTPASCRTAVQ